MDDRTLRMHRREFLKLAGAAGATAGLGAFLAACGASASPSARAAAAPSAAAPSAVAGGGASAAPTPGPTGTFNWLTWGDHW